MEGNIPRHWGTSTVLLLSGTIEYIQSLMKKMNKAIQKMIQQMDKCVLKFWDSNFMKQTEIQWT